MGVRGACSRARAVGAYVRRRQHGSCPGSFGNKGGGDHGPAAGEREGATVSAAYARASGRAVQVDRGSNWFSNNSTSTSFGFACTLALSAPARAGYFKATASTALWACSLHSLGVKRLTGVLIRVAHQPLFNSVWEERYDDIARWDVWWCGTLPAARGLPDVRIVGTRAKPVAGYRRRYG